MLLYEKVNFVEVCIWIMILEILNSFGSLSPLYFTKMSSRAFLDLPPAAHCLWISGLTSSFPEAGLGLQIRPRAACKAPGVFCSSAVSGASQARGNSGFTIYNYYTLDSWGWLVSFANPLVFHKNSITMAWWTILKKEKQRERERERACQHIWRSLHRCIDVSGLSNIYIYIYLYRKKEHVSNILECLLVMQIIFMVKAAHHTYRHQMRALFPDAGLWLCISMTRSLAFL